MCIGIGCCTCARRRDKGLPRRDRRHQAIRNTTDPRWCAVRDGDLPRPLGHPSGSGVVRAAPCSRGFSEHRPPSMVASGGQSARRGHLSTWLVHSRCFGRHGGTPPLFPERVSCRLSASALALFGQLFRRAPGPDARALTVLNTTESSRLLLLLLHHVARLLLAAVEGRPS